MSDDQEQYDAEQQQAEEQLYNQESSLSDLAGHVVEPSQIKAEKKTARVKAKQEIGELGQTLKDTQDAVNAGIRNAKAEEVIALKKAVYAQKASDIIQEGLYQTTPSDERTPEMGKAHRSFLLRTFSQKALSATKAGLFGALVAATAIKGPDLYEDFMAGGQPQAATANDNAATEKPAPVKSDGIYYIQIGQATKTDPEKLMDGHASCPNENGTISSLWNGNAYHVQGDATEDLKTAKKDYPKAWVVNHVNCG